MQLRLHAAITHAPPCKCVRASGGAAGARTSVGPARDRAEHSAGLPVQVKPALGEKRWSSAGKGPSRYAESRAKA